MQTEKPLILTLKIDATSREYFNRLRQLHFPAAINYIDAHLTLFHHLGSDAAFVTGKLRDFEMPESFRMMVAGLRNLGNGIAYAISGDPLLALHRRLSQEFEPLLTAQDKQKFQPHITIQNKVPAVVSRALLETLKINFEPFEITAIGISVWLYAGGPWEHLMDIDFKRGNED